MHQQHPPCKSSCVEKAPSTTKTCSSASWPKSQSQAKVSRLNDPSCFDKYRQGLGSFSFQQGTGTPAQLRAVQWPLAPDVLMGTARTGSDHTGTQGQQHKAQPTASTAKHPQRNQHPHFWAGGMEHRGLKNMGCHFAQRREAGAGRSQQLWLTSCHSTAQHTSVQPRLQQELAQANTFLSFDFNLAKMLWTQMNSLCKSNIVFLIFKCELQVPR